MYAGYRSSCAVSFLCGFLFTILITSLLKSNDRPSSSPNIMRSIRILENEMRQSMDEMKNYLKTQLTLQLNGSTLQKSEGNGHHASAELFPPSPEFLSEEDDIPALVNKAKILCWVLTGPKNHKRRAIHVKRTWGRRCDKLLFISSQQDASLPTTVLKGIKENRTGLWGKTRGTFQLIYEKYLDEADFFLKADDDTYVVVENLRYLLKDYDSSLSLYFGCHFDIKRKKGKGISHSYHSGGAGYVLSKGAVKELVEKGFRSRGCKRATNPGPEDVNLGDCFKATNVTFVDTRDKYGRHRFSPFSPKQSLMGPTPKWFEDYTKFPLKKGIDCCSDIAVSFHYVAPKDLYLFEYFLYHLRPYGVHDFGGEDDNDNQTLIIEKI